MKSAYLVCGLAYGDEGKGATVDYLCRKFDAGLVVRYNGGSQAAHNVVTPDGRHHTFSQFGSGTFIPGVKTYLSRFTLINPINMMREEEHLKAVGVLDAWDRLSVDCECLVVTPFHRAANRALEEARGDCRHGSCGQGIGQCRSDNLIHGQMSLFAGDLRNEWMTKEKLLFLQQVNRRLVVSIGKVKIDPVLEDPEAIDWIWNLYKQWPAKTIPPWDILENTDKTDVVVFEGAQGVLLDEKYGVAPYNTWTNTTFENALTLLQEWGYQGAVKKIGVIRTYFTRHGAGPFRTEYLDHMKKFFPEPHNNCHGYQGKFRIGEFDRELFFHAIRICHGIDGLALNHVDIRPGYSHHLENEIKTPILIEGYGPTANDRKWIPVV